MTKIKQNRIKDKIILNKSALYFGLQSQTSLSGWVEKNMFVLQTEI